MTITNTSQCMLTVPVTKEVIVGVKTLVFKYV